MPKYIDINIKKLFLFSSENHEYIVKHKLSRSLVCAENKEANVVVLQTSEL